MVPTVQFTAFHKFLVSVGGLLIVSSLALPYFLLRGQPSLMHTEQQLATLTAQAKETIEKQQQGIAWLAQWYPWLSGFLAVAGIVLVLVGGRIWASRQKDEDKLAQAELRKRNFEADKTHQEALKMLLEHQQTDEEMKTNMAEVGQESVADAGVDESATNEALIPTRQVGEEIGHPLLKKGSRTEAMLTGISKYIKARTAVADELRLMYGSEVDVVTEVRFGRHQCDIAMLSRAVNVPDMIIDVHVVRGERLAGLNQLLSKVVNWTDEAVRSARQELQRDFRPVVVLVLDHRSDELRKQVQRRVMEFASKYDPSPLPPIIITNADSPRLPHDLGDIASSIRASVVVTS